MKIINFLKTVDYRGLVLFDNTNRATATFICPICQFPATMVASTELEDILTSCELCGVIELEEHAA